MARETRHRQYNIRSISGADGAKARAFHGKSAVGEARSAETEEAAIAAVAADLDRMHAEQLARRGADGYPTTEEVRAALTQVVMTNSQQAMLRAHLDAPGETLTATQIAKSGGYDSWVSANSQYGALGRKLAEQLDWNPPLRADGTPVWTYALAKGENDDDRAAESEIRDEEHWRWKLRREVREAAKDLF